MLNKLKQMIDRFTTNEDDRQPTFEDHKLATAALLVHATHIDGETDLEEQAKLREILRTRYELDDEQVVVLIRFGEHSEQQAVDLYGFTRRISRELAPEERLRIIEMLWEIVFADGIVHEFEENLVWRVAELLHVPSRERIRLRQLAAAKSAAIAEK